MIATCAHPGLVLSHTLEGDILLNPTQLKQYTESSSSSSRETRAVTMIETAKWPGGIVPYELSPSLSELCVVCSVCVGGGCGVCWGGGGVGGWRLGASVFVCIVCVYM